MFELFERYFDGVPRRQFDGDLARKSHVVLLEKADGALAGFSTLLLYRLRHEGEELNVVYSGDTIVDTGARHSAALSRTWIDTVHRLHAQKGGGRLVWLLLTSGFRTYRFLPVYWQTFWPRHDRPTPARTQRLIDRLAGDRFGPAYDPTRGVVRLDPPPVLRESNIPPARRADPHVAFFSRANPGHADGDELVCLTEPVEANLTSAGRRMVAAGARRRDAQIVPEPAA